MNDSVDYLSLFLKNVRELRSHLQDPWPLSDERLFARQNYEELLKNLNRRAKAAGYEPDMIEPEFPSLLKAFVRQNVDAEAYLRKSALDTEYERGRADMRAAIQTDAVPDSFRGALPVDPDRHAVPSSAMLPAYEAILPGPDSASPAGGFDPEKGRVAIEDLKKFKTAGAERIVPLHPLMIELGLLERVRELRERGCPVLFPEWEPYKKPDGDMRWGQPITKSWQYLKQKVGITRHDVAAYSARHTYADFLDQTGVSHGARMQAMGHSRGNDIPARYGLKKRFLTRDLDEIASIATPEIQAMIDILTDAKARADAGELIVRKPWLHRSNWSDYYRKKLG